MKKIDIEIELKIIELYINDKLSTVEIAKILNISSTTVSNLIKKNGFRLRSISDSKKGKIKISKLPEEEIIKLYLKEGKPSTEISKILCCSKRSVLNVLKKYNIKTRERYHESYKKIHIKKEEIQNLYLKGLSMLQISKEINVPYSTINNILKNLNIIRSFDIRKGSKGKTQSEETKNKVRNTRKLKKEAGSYDHIYLKKTGYTYEDYQKILPEFKKYYQKVRVITNQQPLITLKNYEKRGISGEDNNYHLDHKYSIAEGFKNNIPPEIIGNISNLIMLPWEINLLKNSNCSITIDELYRLYNLYIN